MDNCHEGVQLAQNLRFTNSLKPAANRALASLTAPRCRTRVAFLSTSSWTSFWPSMRSVLLDSSARACSFASSLAVSRKVERTPCRSCERRAGGEREGPVQLPSCSRRCEARHLNVVNSSGRTAAHHLSTSRLRQKLSDAVESNTWLCSYLGCQSHNGTARLKLGMQKQHF